MTNRLYDTLWHQQGISGIPRAHAIAQNLARPSLMLVRSASSTDLLRNMVRGEEKGAYSNKTCKNDAPLKLPLLTADFICPGASENDNRRTCRALMVRDLARTCQKSLLSVSLRARKASSN
ncbi:unnamed protein product [Periconia digitata]|uniref:Uncharacterized protein n=1 Tax=Periconia digitata TaxID=1303443 RepID=A0A9W4UCW6_9PLEO|nr:unnamed protein product [Periconia digitata]